MKASEIDEKTYNDIIKIVGKFCIKNRNFVKLFDSYEDFVSENVVLVIRKIHLYDNTRAAFSTFINKICYNYCLAKLRKNKNKSKIITYSEYYDIEKDNALNLIENQIDEKMNVEEIVYKNILLKKLKLSNLLYDYAINNKTQNELAKKYNIAQSIISRRLRKEQENLKEILKN